MALGDDGREALVHIEHGDIRPLPHSGTERTDLPSPGALFTRQFEGQPQDNSPGIVRPNEIQQRLDRGTFTAPAVQGWEWRCQPPRRVTERKAHPDLSEVDSQDPSFGFGHTG